MNYELTQHAKDMLQGREVAIEWLRGTGHVPDSLIALSKYVGFDES